ncbi:MAG TPA: diguanylate cyclase [Candidatus Baltobacteraceae bacterium]|nr:diguanylate cyclase [Candidatus Baltobacteraceae bacterium]
MKHDRARGVDETSAPILRSHQHRLQAVWDLSLGDHFSSDNQLHALLSDATAALQAEYAELYSVDDQTYLSAGSSDATAVLDLANYAPEYSLGATTTEVVDPLLIGDTDQDAIWGAHPLVTAIPLRSVIVMPLQHSGKRHMLLVAWKTRRTSELSEEETGYLKFFQRIITRLLENLDREREITSRIVTDHLTGLYNRAAMMEQIAIAVSSASRTNESLAVFYVDLDGFKELNDTYGHALGDAALQQASARMRAVLRKHESAGRVGGDEFALLVTQFADEEQLTQIAKRILAALRDPVVTGGAKAKVTASIGIAVYPKHGTTPEQLMEHADRAMYQAKRRAGDGFSIFGAAEEPAGTVHHLLSAQLANAVMEREFFLCYQPIVYARTGKPLAAEALLRWLHPAMGMLSPLKFLDESRDAQVLNKIESWVLASALEKQTRLRAVGRRLTMHINVSEPNPDLLDLTHESLPDLRLEISENAIAADEKPFIRFINAARDRGLRVGVSNFGSGRLSLGVMAELPLEFVKVTPDVRLPVVETAHHFGWMVIAENVEDMRQRETLITLGVDALQGYYVCSPLAESDFDNWLEYQQR